MNNFLVVIPARYKSKRLPGKPLIEIKGVPMLIRTYNRCLQCVKKNKIVIATDHKKIFNLCKQKNINCLMTSKKCLTGTDRVAEVARKIRAKVYINIQADEPLLQKNDLINLIKYAKKNPKEIINGFFDLNNKKCFMIKIQLKC